VPPPPSTPPPLPPPFAPPPPASADGCSEIQQLASSLSTSILSLDEGLSLFLRKTAVAAGVGSSTVAVDITRDLAGMPTSEIPSNYTWAVWEAALPSWISIRGASRGFLNQAAGNGLLLTQLVIDSAELREQVAMHTSNLTVILRMAREVQHTILVSVAVTAEPVASQSRLQHPGELGSFREVVVGAVVSFTMASRDINGLPMTHNAAQKLRVEEQVVTAGSWLARPEPAVVEFVDDGRYDVRVVVPLAGTYTYTVWVLEGAGWAAMAERVVVQASCPASEVPTANGSCVCALGYSRREAACVRCGLGSYSDQESDLPCTSCSGPRTTTAEIGSANASSCVCTAGYFRGLAGECVFCAALEGVDVDRCVAGVSVETLPLLPNYWRHSARSMDVRRCNPLHASSNMTTCVPPASSTRRQLSEGPPLAGDDVYCTAGHTGPLCSVCDQEYYRATEGSNFYFDQREWQCKRCGNIAVALAIWLLVLLAVVAAGLLLYTCVHIPEKLSPRLRSATPAVRFIALHGSRLGLQGKIKTVITFFQICSVLNSVYGVLLPPELARSLGWIDIFTSFFLQGLAPECLSGGGEGVAFSHFGIQLLIHGLWPFILILAINLVVTALAVLMQRPKGSATDRLVASRHRQMYIYLVVTSLCVPSVMSALFEVFQCTSYVDDSFLAGQIEEWQAQGAPTLSQQLVPGWCLEPWREFRASYCTPDNAGEQYCHTDETIDFDTWCRQLAARRGRAYYLQSDQSVHCFTSFEVLSFEWYGEQLPDYRERIYLPVAWVLIVIWLLVVCSYGALLWRDRVAVQTQRMTKSADATRFLWKEYQVEFFFWEVVEVVRKLLLTTLIVIVVPDGGSAMRLVIAAFVSIAFLALTSLAMPFARSDDDLFAVFVNLLLSFVFLSGLLLKLCSYDDGLSCRQMFSLQSADSLTDFFVAMTAVVFTGLVVVVAWKVTVSVYAPTIRLKSTHREPMLEIPSGNLFHAFISHVWGTGQDQTHAIVRQLQLKMPMIKVWLDVDHLNDLGNLEDSVGVSVAFVVFLSKGYFRSKNCRRELYAAIDLGKNIIVVLETDEQKGGATLDEMQQECSECCADRPDAAYKVFQTPPILWVRAHDFQLVSIKMIALQILRELKATSPRILAKGVYVPGELAPVLLDASTVILACKSNKGASELAAEVRDRSEVKVVVAEDFLSDRCSHGDDGSHSSGRDALAAPSELSQLSELPELPQPSQPSELPQPSALEMASAAHGEGVHRAAARPGLYLLLYLNKDTFLDADEETARCVRAALKGGIRVVLIHEKDPERGGVPFRVFFANTPEDLMIRHGLYNTVAVPLYSSPPYRAVSKILIRKAMGGVRIRPKVSKLALHLSRITTGIVHNNALNQLSEMAWTRALVRMPTEHWASAQSIWWAPWSPRHHTVETV